MSKNAKKILAVALLLVVVAAAVLLYLHFRPQPVEGAKTLAVTVVHGDESKKEFVLHTDAENLHEALDEQKLIEGEDRGGFFMVLVVDGETADEAQQQWWCFNDGAGNMLETGVDTTMIQDGDSYEIVLKTGW